jgi:antitoxin (DNA-binding transcriptional repressor) of toxin-antitoxin stability system
MKIFTIYNAKTNLSSLIKEALAGEEIVIAKGNLPLVKLVVIGSDSGERKIGLLKGKIKTKKNFDDELKDFEEYLP